MPYASEAMRRAHKRALASHACESAPGEIDRVVALVHRDLSKPRQSGTAFGKIAAGLEDAIAFARGDETRGRLIMPGRFPPPAG